MTASLNRPRIVLTDFTYTSPYTEEEFETAFGQFKATNKPFIFTYFKDAPISTGALNDDVLSLLQLKKKLSALGHFYTVYKNLEDLQLKFGRQLDKLADSGFVEFKREKDDAAAPSIRISHSKNVVAGSLVNTGGGDFIVGDRNSPKK